MKDIIFKYDKEQKCFDIDLENPIGDSLYSRISLLLFTNARCEKYELPLQEKSRRGFWADSLDKSNTGSKLWLLDRAKISGNILDTAKSYCYQALEILINEGVISDLKIETYFANKIMVIEILVNTLNGSKKYSYNVGD